MKKFFPFLLCVAILMVGCGNNAITVQLAASGSSSTAPAIDDGQSVTITATLANDSSGKGVTWALTSGPGALANPTSTTVTYNAPASGSGSAVITATSVTDTTKSQPITITVSVPPSVTTTQANLTNSPASATNPYSFTFTASGGTGSLSWTATGLPAWATLSSAGVLTGTPPSSGTAGPFTVTVKDSSTAGSVPTTSGSFTLTINPAPALSITKTHTGNFLQGQQNATYTVTVSNGAAAGPTIGTTVTVTETVPSAETLVSMSGSGWTCPANGTTCTRSDVLAAGASYPAITVTVNVSSSATSPQTNKVAVSGGGSAGANTTDPTTIVSPILTITKSHSGSFNVGQQNATYTVTVSNSAAATAPTGGTVTVTESVPMGETLVSMAGTGWTCPAGGNTCTRSDTLAIGSSYPAITVTVNVSSSITSPSVTNNVSVSGGGSASANTSDPTTILYPVLTIAKTHTGSFNLGQQNATYAVTVTNNGTGAAAPTVGTVTMTETVPTGETLVSMAGTGWTCPSGGNTCTRSDALGVGLSYPPITVTVNVSSSITSPSVTNNVSVSGGASVTANASDLTNILYPAFTITKTHTGNFLQGQSNATYSVTVGNNGSAPTVGTVTMTEMVPTGETLVSMSGTGWTCPSGGTTCTRSDTLGVGLSYPLITVTVNVSSTAPTPQVNQVSVSGGGTLAAANGSDSTIIVEPVLTITKTHTGNFTLGQSGATYTVTVSNSVTATASTSGTVTVTETVPAGETLVSMSGTGWTCPGAGGANTCDNAGVLAPGSSYQPLTVTVNVSSTAPTPQVNQASVSGGGSASASASDSTTIIQPVLTITKSHTGNFTQGQTGATYTVTVSNSASATASTSGTVTVTETVPTGETFVSMSGTGWTCPGAGGANTCDNTGVLAPGSSYQPITVTVNVAGNATSPLVNQVSVSGGGSVGTASASDSTIINALSVAIISGSFTTIAPGAIGVTVTAQVTNDIGSQGVTWTLTAGGSPCAPTCGSVSGATTTSVTYTPPASVPSSPNNNPTITATSVANGSKSASFSFTIAAACGTGSESLLNGQYAMVLEGFDANGPVALGATFNADGSGHIATTVGVEDLDNSAGVQGNVSIVSANSSYTVGSDHRGCLTIATASGTQFFRFSLGSISGTPLVASEGRMIQFDPLPAEHVVGTLRKQTSAAFSTSSITGGFAFGIAAAENNSGSLGRFGAVGMLSFNGSGTVNTTSVVDFNDNGTVDNNGSTYPASPVSITGGTYSIAANGRGTVSFTGTGSTTTATLYVVSSSELLIINGLSTDWAYTGRALKQSGSFSTSSINAPMVLYSSGLSSSTSPPTTTRTSLGIVTVPSAGTVSYSGYKNDSGIVGTDSSGGSVGINVAASGRVTITSGGGGGNPLFYLVSANEAFALFTDNNVESGFMEPQSGSSFTNASANGTYSFGTIRPGDTNVGDEEGVAIFDGAGTITGTSDQNAAGTLNPSGTISQTYSIDSNGTGHMPAGCTITSNCDNMFVVVSSTKAILMKTKSSNPNPSLQVAAQ